MQRTFQRLLVTLTVSGGLLAAAATAANAGLTMNHSEPVAHDHR
jgi:hypothetical protein